MSTAASPPLTSSESSSTDSLVLVNHPPLDNTPPRSSYTASSLSSPPAHDSTTPAIIMSSSTPAPANAAVLNTGAQGIGKEGQKTLDALQSDPALIGGADPTAVVGGAKGEQPEVIAQVTPTKDPWYKRIATSVKSELSNNDNNSDDMPPPSPSVPQEVALGTVAPDNKQTEPVVVVTDQSGKAVPTTFGTNTVNNNVAGSILTTTSSVKDVVEQHHLDPTPATTNAKFHSLFSDIPEDDELIEDYRCALQKDILVQGRLFVSEHHIAFRANIFGWETSVMIPFSEVTTIERRMTAKIVPNAIEIATANSRYTFSSLLARDSAYQLLVAIWQHAHPGEQRARDRSDSFSTFTRPDNSDSSSEISFEDEDGNKKKHRFSTALAGVGHKLKSIRSRDYETGERSEADKVKDQARKKDSNELGHPATEYDGEEYANVALDVVLPTSPEKAYKIFFTDEEFLKPFLEENQGLKELEMGPWEDEADGDLQHRDMSYIKPLNAPVGPKQTHCNISDVNQKVDPELYIANETTTRTPDVPSGNDFSVKTKTVFTWSDEGGTRVKVTTEVAWTKVNRMLKGIIERSCIDGQKKYHADLEKAVREHMEANPDKFSDPGVTTTGNKSASKESKDAAATSDSSSGGLLDYLPSAFTLLVTFVVILAFTNFWTLIALRHQARAAHEARLGNPGEVASAVSRVLGQFEEAHRKRVGGEAVVGAIGREVEGVLQVVQDLAEGLRSVEDRLRGIQSGL